MTAPLSYSEARSVVSAKMSDLAGTPAQQVVPLDASPGRVLAAAVTADRDYPPFNRSARDGFAVISSDVASAPVTLDCIGETRAGEPSRFALQPGQTVEIMTGAPGPANSDAVVMVEYSERQGSSITLHRPIAPGRNLIPAGSETAQGETVLEAGMRIGYPTVALLGTVGCDSVPVFRRPEVAILSTGDEVLPVVSTPASYQIRNSNAHSLAAQVRRRGGIPRILPVARDRLDETRRRIEEGLRCDLLLLSGGVSMGKHDLVEEVLDGLGAEIYFTRVRIQPGKPLVFASVGGTPVFGLPGNPLSTMVTFEVFASIAVARLAGLNRPRLPFLKAPLAEPFRHKPVLTRFIGARLDGEGSAATVRRNPSQGSGDVQAFAGSDCYMVATEDREEWAAGDLIDVLPL